MKISIRFNVCQYFKSYSSFLHEENSIGLRAMSHVGQICKTSQRYSDAVRDLNDLQSNQHTVKLAQFNDPRQKLAIFKEQIELAGLNVVELNKLNIIHIGGTKGKGSTCVFIENILRRNNIKTGFYNSPHLISVNERIQINGQPLDYEKFAKYFYEIYNRLKNQCEKYQKGLPTYFSFLTIMAFHVFLSEKVECAIIEVGIGGEYDPTNVIEKPVACGITTLDYDHTNMLGNKIESIAKTKAGICKPGVPLFTVNQSSYKSTLDIIEARAADSSSPMYICEPLKNLADCQLGIKGRAQLSNAALACNISEYFLSTHKQGSNNSKFSRESHPSQLECDFASLPNSFQDALTDCSWQGRCQTLTMSEKLIYFLDGAHTVESMKNCLQWFHENSSNCSNNICKILLVNIVGDRNREDILSPLIHYKSFDYVIFSSNVIDLDSCRIRDDIFGIDKRDNMIHNMHLNLRAWNNLSKIESDMSNTKCISSPTIKESVDLLNEFVVNECDKRFEVLVTGSLHFVGSVLKSLQNETK